MDEWLKEIIDQSIRLTSSYGISTIGAILTLIIGFWFSRILEKFVGKALKKTEKIDETISVFLTSITRYLILIFTFLAVLGQVGVETTSIVAILGAASLAIGLAMQGTLSNVAAGVMLLIFRPFKVDDFVDAGGISGTIKKIGLFSTEMDTSGNIRIITPNSRIWGTSIQNFSFNTNRRLQFDIGIGYDDDINKAIDIIKALIEKDDRALSYPEPTYAVGALGESSVNLIIRVWCQRDFFTALKWDLLKIIKETFDEEGITIPYSHRVIETKISSK